MYTIQIDPIPPFWKKTKLRKRTLIGGAIGPAPCDTQFSHPERPEPPPHERAAVVIGIPSPSCVTSDTTDSAPKRTESAARNKPMSNKSKRTHVTSNSPVLYNRGCNPFWGNTHNLTKYHPRLHHSDHKSTTIHTSCNPSPPPPPQREATAQLCLSIKSIPAGRSTGRSTLSSREEVSRTSPPSVSWGRSPLLIRAADPPSPDQSPFYARRRSDGPLHARLATGETHHRSPDPTNGARSRPRIRNRHTRKQALQQSLHVGNTGLGWRSFGAGTPAS